MTKISKQVIPETPPDFERTRIVERPDGFYWKHKGAPEEYGPFDTLLGAVLDMQASDSGSAGSEESLQELEAEIGIADWVDPDTGEPAEESRPHIEDN